MPQFFWNIDFHAENIGIFKKIKPSAKKQKLEQNKKSKYTGR